MNRSTLTFGFLFLVYAVSSADLDWEWRNPLPAGYHLKSISVLDENTAIAVGEHGSILKTTDGNTWDIISKEVQSYYSKIYFVDSLSGWIFGSTNNGSNRIVLQTVDGGKTWTEHIGEGVELYYDLFFANENIGWFSSLNKIFKTVDGGVNWQERYSDTNHTFYSLYFINADTGWVTGCNGTILKTTDGGVSWTPFATPDDRNNILDLFFTDADTGWAVGGSPLLIGYIRVIMKTVDGGEHWKILNDGGSGIYESVYFTDNNTGWICTHLGNILKTTDGGEEWNVQIDFKNGDLNALHFANNNVGYCVGYNGRILKTLDSGENWTLLSQGELPYSSWLYTIHFSNENTGWAGGCWQANPVTQPILYKTDDAGEHWKEVALISTNESFTIVDIFFPDQQHGWILQNTGSISLLLTTEDSGKTWQEMTPDLDSAFNGNALFFVNTDTGYIAGVKDYYTGRIIKTMDSGNTWEVLSIGSDIPCLNDIVFSNAQKGWAVGKSGTILHTSDGGTTWQLQEPPVNKEFSAVQFIDDNKGWIVGTNKILATYNGGKTWIDKSPTMSRFFIFKSIFFTDSKTGWITTDTDTTLFTANAGDSWEHYPTDIGRNISTIYSRDGRNLWAAGNYATILHAYYDGPIAIKENNNEISQQQLISMNIYPNPVTQKAYFTFHVPASSVVSLAVYNLSGKCIASVIDKQKMITGSKCITWNRRDAYGMPVPPGVYIAKLITQSYVKTIRFILL